MTTPQINYERLYQTLKVENGIAFEEIKEVLRRQKEFLASANKGVDYEREESFILFSDLIFCAFKRELYEFLENDGIIHSGDWKVIVGKNKEATRKCIMEHIEDPKIVLEKTIDMSYMNNIDEFLMYEDDYIHTLKDEPTLDERYDTTLIDVMENPMYLMALKEVYERNIIHFEEIQEQLKENNLTLNDVKNIINFEKSISKLSHDEQEEKREEFLENIGYYNGAFLYYRDMTEPYEDEMNRLIENGKILTNKDSSIIIGLNNKETMEKIIEVAGDYKTLFDSIVKDGYFGAGDDYLYYNKNINKMISYHEGMFAYIPKNYKLSVIENVFFNDEG